MPLSLAPLLVTPMCLSPGGMYPSRILAALGLSARAQPGFPILTRNEAPLPLTDLNSENMPMLLGCQDPPTRPIKPGLVVMLDFALEEQKN